MSYPDANDHVLALLGPLRATGHRAIILADDPARARRTLDSRGHPDVVVRRRHGPRGLVTFLLARWVFVTHASFRRIPSPPWQTLVNVWHGMPIKSVGTMDLRSGQAPRSAWYTIASSERFVPVMSRAMDVPSERVLVTGNPWCDRLLDADGAARARATLGLGPDTPLVLHMPTFRRRTDGIGGVDGVVGAELVPSTPHEAAELGALLDRHGAVWVSKPHPSALDHLELGDSDRIVTATDEWMAEADLTTYELLAAADVLVTDVSSVLLDFLVTDRPIVGWFPDLVSYREHRRLEFEPYEDAFPGVLCQEWPDLLRAVDGSLTADRTGDRRARLRASVLRPGVGSYGADLVDAVFDRPSRARTYTGRTRRISPGLIDQGVYSASNLALGVAVATSVSATAFGQFNVMMALIVLAIGLSRALGGEVLALPSSDENDPAVVRDALGQAATLGLVTGLGLTGGGLLFEWLPTRASVVVGVLLPGLLVQNVLRYIAFARGRHTVALTMDLLWLVGTVAAAVVAPRLAAAGYEVAALAGAWAVSGVLAAGVGLVQLHVDPRGSHPLRFSRATWRTSRPLVLEYLSVGGAGQFGIVLIGLFATVETVAALRGAHLVFGLITVLTTGVVALGVPETSKLVAADRHRTGRRVAVAAALIVALATLANYLLLLVAGDTLGTRVLGDTWVLAAAVLLPVAVTKGAEGGITAAIMTLRAQGRAHVGAKIRSLGTLAGVAATVVAAALFGALGAAIAAMVLAVLTAAALWRPLRHVQATG